MEELKFETCNKRKLSIDISKFHAFYCVHIAQLSTQQNDMRDLFLHFSASILINKKTTTNISFGRHTIRSTKLMASYLWQNSIHFLMHQMLLHFLVNHFF